MKKIFLLGAALGLALTVPQTPNAMGAEDKKESAFEWGYWNSGIAPAAGPVALNVDPTRRARQTIAKTRCRSRCRRKI